MVQLSQGCYPKSYYFAVCILNGTLSGSIDKRNYEACEIQLKALGTRDFVQI